MVTKITPPQDAMAWLREFARCVRGRTYDAARPLFDEGVYSFGTVAYEAHGLDDLVSHQWREVWDVTDGFDFDYANAVLWKEHDLACIAVAWVSTGHATDGTSFDRLGRATLVLRRTEDAWKAVHTHFSMMPE